MQPLRAAALLLLLAGCATPPLTSREVTSLRDRLHAEGFTQDVEIKPQGGQLRVFAMGPDGRATDRTYDRDGLRLRREFTDRGDNSFLRQELDRSGHATHVEFWVGED